MIIFINIIDSLILYNNKQKIHFFRFLRHWSIKTAMEINRFTLYIKACVNRASRRPKKPEIDCIFYTTKVLSTNNKTTTKTQIIQAQDERRKCFKRLCRSLCGEVNSSVFFLRQGSARCVFRRDQGRKIRLYSEEFCEQKMKRARSHVWKRRGLKV